MNSNRIVEYVFFFGFMGVVAYMVWTMLQPFVSALALAAIIVTICYPLYERILPYMPKRNRTLGAMVTTIAVLVLVIIPFTFLISSLVNEAFTVYGSLQSERASLSQQLDDIQTQVNTYLPTANIDIVAYVEQAASWLAGKAGAIFAGTAATVFSVFIAIIGAFYLFRDGKQFTKHLVIYSPLPDDEDEYILSRLALAVRSVATGTILIALIQGSLTAFGLWLFGFERFVLWGVVAAFGALIPSVGTSIVFIPAILYLVSTGSYGFAVGLSIWGATAVGLVDNLLGPYLMSRGNSMHPYVVLLAVLGGIGVFGPIGFIVGPVIVSLFMVLLELYATHMQFDTRDATTVKSE